MLLKWIMATLIHVVISLYVGDVFIVETADAMQSAVEIFKIVCATLGFELETSKEQAPTTKIALLGADVSIEDSRLTATLPIRKANELLGELRQIIQKDTLTPAHAAKKSEGAWGSRNHCFLAGSAGPSIMLSHHDSTRNYPSDFARLTTKLRKPSIGGSKYYHAQRRDKSYSTPKPDASVRWRIGSGTRGHRVIFR